VGGIDFAEGKSLRQVTKSVTFPLISGTDKFTSCLDNLASECSIMCVASPVMFSNQ